MATTYFEHRNALPRSQSSSNIPDLPAITTTKNRRPIESEEGLLRAASYTHIPSLDTASYAPNRGSLIETSPNIIPSSEGVRKDRSGYPPVAFERPKLGRRKSLADRSKSWMSKVTGSPVRGAGPEGKTSPMRIPVVPVLTPLTTSSPEKARSGTFASFAKKSWMKSSRSPSPSPIRKKQKDMDESSLEKDDSTAASSISSSSPRTSDSVLAKSEHLTNSKQSTPTSPKRRTLAKQKSRDGESRTPADLKGDRRAIDSPAEALQKKSFRDRPGVPITPKAQKDRLANGPIELPRKRDELWNVFRSLDNDFQKFQTKPTVLRVNVIRSSILPFLKTYAEHPSNKSLQPEELDRRTVVLNKWWIGLLDIFDGRNSHHLSGVDRPVVLDSIIGIMMRPEWRLAPSQFAPLAPRNSSDLSRTPSSSSSSLSGTDSQTSQFLADSIYHNVRNMFIQNLLTQTGIVVDKMCLRHAPASVVMFCGKTLSHAFFFCPGIADILIGLWGLSTETARRIVGELGLTGGADRRIDELTSHFPPNMQTIRWTSMKVMANRLRRRIDLPPGTSNINWHGSWIARWCGRDSDLFFIFCKHYHILLEEFLPEDIQIAAKARSPGFVYVHAQLLATLDSTIHRPPPGDPSMNQSPMTLDDILSGMDASASALPLSPSANATRLMSDNRLVMLLRDFLSDHSAEYATASRTFAETFSLVLRAAAKKTSQFDHNSCFLLCDFLEEASNIYMTYQNAQLLENDFIDWPFWLEVCRKMLLSQNSMSEIRVFSFIFGAWKAICRDQHRKEVLCLDWLLKEDFFYAYFNHWCPMVRAFYMRLLCWRVCRFEGEASALDTKILSGVSDRLKVVWANYQYLRNDAEKNFKLSPSTAAGQPAPGRRLMIIRNDTQAAAASLMLGFDAFSALKALDQKGPPYSRNSMVLKGEDTVTLPTNEPRKRWSLLGKIIPFSTVSSPMTAGPSSPPTNISAGSTPLEIARASTAASRRSSVRTTRHRSSSSSGDSTPSAPASPTQTHRAYNFKFSLEWSAMPQTHSAFHQQLSSSPQNSKKSNASFSAYNSNVSNNNYNSGHNSGINASPTLQRILRAPRLPALAQTYLVSMVPGTANQTLARKPEEGRLVTARYGGRALSEWAVVVQELNNFVERRLSEGVPSLKHVEVPTLGVDGFRKC